MDLKRHLNDPVAWAYLILLTATLTFTVVIAWQTSWIKHQMAVVKGQNEWSMEDRARLHDSQEDTKAALRRLESFVDEVRQAEDRRRKARGQ